MRSASSGAKVLMVPPLTFLRLNDAGLVAASPRSTASLKKRDTVPSTSLRVRYFQLLA
jgi:hypothetical protein